VWLNVNDLVHGVPASVYQGQLTTLLRDLRAGGRTEVLVANTPPLDRLPRVLQCQPFAPNPEGGCDRTRRLPISEVVAAVNLYNVAIERAAAASGAILVDLHAWGESVDRSGDLSRFVGTDGWHPSTLGYRRIAGVFAKAYEEARPPSPSP
jgi:lysophospholipase L1-like esterase